MRALSDLLYILEFGAAAPNFDELMWVALVGVALLALLAHYIVSQGREGARVLVLPVMLVQLAVPVACGALLLQGGMSLYWRNSTIERVGRHLHGRVAGTKGEALEHDFGLLLAHAIELEGHSRVYRDAGSTLRDRLEVGDDLNLWYREDDRGRTITILQADINGQRVLTWKPNWAIPVSMMVMGLGLLGTALVAVVMVSSRKRTITVDHNLQLVEEPAEGSTAISTFVGAWRHVNGPLDETLIISEDGSVSGAFASTRGRMQFRAKLTVTRSGLGVAKGHCDLFLSGELRGTVPVRFRLRSKGNDLSGSLRIPPLSEADSEIKLSFRLTFCGEHRQ